MVRYVQKSCCHCGAFYPQPMMQRVMLHRCSVLGKPLKPLEKWVCPIHYHPPLTARSEGPVMGPTLTGLEVEFRRRVGDLPSPREGNTTESIAQQVKREGNERLRKYFETR